MYLHMVLCEIALIIVLLIPWRFYFCPPFEIELLPPALETCFFAMGATALAGHRLPLQLASYCLRT